MMLWGMTLQPGYEYTEVVGDEVRLSMASLECRPRKSQNGSFELSSHVVLKTMRGEFLLCTLEKGPTPQQSLDLVLQPRERVTFSVEGTGVVHLMGYTSECPDDQGGMEAEGGADLSAEEQEIEEPPPMPEEEETSDQQQENQEIVIKNEPEAVIVPILEEALEDMDVIAKSDAGTPTLPSVHTAMQGTAHMQGNIPQSLLPVTTEEYAYQEAGLDEGWIDHPQISNTNPTSRVDTVYPAPQSRALQGTSRIDIPSTSYPSQAHAGESSRLPAAAPATSGAGSYYQKSPSGGPWVDQNRSIVAPRHPDTPTRRCEPLNKSNQSKCRLCGMEFNDRQHLLIHESAHMGKKLHRCEVCGRCFRLSSNLKTHQRKHTGEKPYSCQYCSKRFASSSNCKIHERCHTGEKPFKCRYCHMCFITSSNCRKHERRHTGEKPYVCHVCGRAFSTQRSHKEHTIKHAAAMETARQTIQQMQ